MTLKTCTIWLISTALVGQAQIARCQTPDEKPPAAVGEEAKKETRGFASALVHNLADDVKHMPRRNSAYWLVGGTALAFAIHPEDGKINRRLVGNPTMDKVFKPGKWLGNSGFVLGAAGTTYLIGRQKNASRLQHLGMDLIEATILGEGTAELAKLAIRRSRPLNPDGVSQSHGYSMPSGHATVTFAAATVLQQHLGYKAAIPTYLVASYVAMSRLHDNRHYSSDVVMGAATGIIVGRSVTYHGRNFWGGPVLVPGGMALMFTRMP